MTSENFRLACTGGAVGDDEGLEPDVDVALGAAPALVDRQGCSDGVEGGGSDGDAGQGKAVMSRPR
jgi:hypothetical protein